MKTVTFDETKWRLVPVEPDEAMVVSCCIGASFHITKESMKDMRRALISAILAAPTPEEP